MANAYEILGVLQSATNAEIYNAFASITGPRSTASKSRTFGAIKAFSLLSTPEKRKAYDLRLLEPIKRAGSAAKDVDDTGTSPIDAMSSGSGDGGIPPSRFEGDSLLPPEPPDGSSSSSPHGPGRDPTSILEEILAALKAMGKKEEDEKDALGFTKGSLAELLVSLSLIGQLMGSPSTNIGKFAARSFGVVAGAIGKQAKVRDFFKARAKKRATATKAKSGASPAGVGGEEAGALEGTEAGALAIPGVGEMIIAGVIFTQAAFEFGKAVYEFALAQEKEIRRLSEFGPMQAQGIALLDAGRTLRDIKTAQETGDSSLRETQRVNEFEEALQPFKSLLMNIENDIAGGLLSMLTDILYVLRPELDAVKGIYDAILLLVGRERIEISATPWDAMKRIADERERMGAPKWPGAP